MSDDEVVPVLDDDAEMVEAINAARASLGQFIAAFLNPKANQESFLLKVRFGHEGEIEHIWMAGLDLGSVPSTGVIANEPKLPGLKFMQRCSFTPNDITDWMFMQDDTLVGGFTTKLLQKRQRVN